MTNHDPRLARLLESISNLLGRRIEWAADATGSESVVVARHGDGAVRAADGLPFTAIQRAFLAEMLETALAASVARTEYDAIGQRLHALERENAELSAKNRTLTEMTSRDSLTGLFNRWYVLDKIEEELNRAWRHGTPLSVMMIDIDHFKNVNDTHGHPTGDQVLQAVGRVLRDSCRVYDTPGRFGGEEFCLMLPETKLESTMAVAERIRRRVEAMPFALVAGSVKVTASVGIAGLDSIPDEGLFGASSLIERADRALYAAKERGRNRVEMWNVGLLHKAASIDH